MSFLTTPLDLADVAQKVESHVRLADQHVVIAARLLAETKARFDSGEITTPTWPEWTSQALSLSSTRIGELVRIGRADDPHAELALLRSAGAERQTRSRAAKAETRTDERMSDFAPAPPEPPLAPEVERLIAWARTAPLHAVRDALAFVTSLSVAPADSQKT